MAQTSPAKPSASSNRKWETLGSHLIIDLREEMTSFLSQKEDFPIGLPEGRIIPF
jgi:hypothetical protein